jgi:endonuclease/exonuclease/phosphatase family metal-dependent hydrolase
LIAFGLIILGGLYLSPAAKSPAVPANMPAGVPDRTLRFVCYDLGRQHLRTDPLFGSIAKFEPDYVFLQGIEEDDVVETAEALQMQATFHPQLYQRSERLSGKRGTWGNLILSKHPIFAAAPIGGMRGGFGVWAVSVVDGKQFSLACLHFSAGEAGAAEVAEFEQVWKGAGSPPMVAAAIYSDPNPNAGIAQFSAIDPRSNGQWFHLTADWKVVASDQPDGPARGRLPVWIDATSAHTDNAATRPSAVNGSGDGTAVMGMPSSDALASRIRVLRP